ncbi:MAG TPA: GDSL-type esterase/lipase family protein [bacterium]|nr:GDSL-type esterase/lipase family protein [bacterium]HQG44482.1 GDSL-type esterase/lipase family protein [bacterium]HQI47422.1 GDSL-type esterase/lipase family protein [bacterium]HQJ63836.1 GDSL-type esterase/lipase family protein [bacterium]
MSKSVLLLLIISLLGNLFGLLVLFKAYDYRKKMILAWAQSDEWASNLQARLTSSNDKAEAVDLVLLGASITAHWDAARQIPGRKIVNKGIDGHYASQLLLRFQHDVVDLHPRAVAIKLCEMNFAHEVPISISQDNIKMLASLAQANSIRPLIATTIPVTAAYDAKHNRKINRQIREFNQWLKDYVSKNKYDLLDLAGALDDGAGNLRAECSDDGVHPNSAGYAIMTQVLSQKLAAEEI